MSNATTNTAVVEKGNELLDAIRNGMLTVQAARNATVYATKADMDAVTPTAGTWDVVVNDPDPANNGYYYTETDTREYSGLQPADASAVNALREMLRSGADDERAFDFVDKYNQLIATLYKSGQFATRSMRLTDSDTELTGNNIGLVLCDLQGFVSSYLGHSRGLLYGMEITPAERGFAIVDRYGFVLLYADDGNAYGISPQHTDPPAHYLKHGTVCPVAADLGQWVSYGSSTLDYFSGHMRQAAARFGALHVNMANAGERSDTIAARMGAIPLRLTFPNDEIPASGIVNVDCNLVTPNYFLPTNGVIAGIEGQLRYSDGWLFERNAAGEVTQITADALFEPADGPALRNCVTIINAGKNDVNSNWDISTTIENVAAMVEFLSPLHLHFIVFANYANPDYSDQRTAKIDAINAEWRRRYGPYFFDVTKWLYDVATLSALNITPTPADIEAIESRRCPPSLLSDGSHWSDATSAYIYEQLVAFIEGLHWYR